MYVLGGRKVVTSWVKVRLTIRVTRRLIPEEDREDEVEYIAKAQIGQVEFLSAGEACIAKFPPNLNLEVRPFDSSGFPAEVDPYICVRATPQKTNNVLSSD